MCTLLHLALLPQSREREYLTRMASKPSLIQIEPDSEIKFIGPFNSTISTTLKVTNITNRKVFFKIKTTAPRSYCVRPNNGLVEPNDTGTVQVMLQPFDYSPNDKDRMKHKFMVQSRYAPEDATTADSDNAFKSVEDGVDIHDARLKCVFEVPPKSEEDISSTNDVSMSPQTLEKKPNQEPAVSSLGSSQFQQASPPEGDPSVRLEIETLRKRNTNLLEENAKLKRSTLESGTRASHTQKSSQIFSLLNIMLALMILVLGWIVGRSF